MTRAEDSHKVIFPILDMFLSTTGTMFIYTVAEDNIENAHWHGAP